MKTGRPDCYIPSAQTLSRDIKNVFRRVRERIGKYLKVCTDTHGTIVTYLYMTGN